MRHTTHNNTSLRAASEGSRRPLLFVLIGLLLVMICGAGAYLFVRQTNRIDALEATLKEQHATLETLRAEQASSTTDLESRLVGLSDTLYATQKQTDSLTDRLGGVTREFGVISSNVATLEKLAKTDPELLQKYSKVYFLNEHYVPDRLTEILADYRYHDNRMERVHASVWPYVRALIDEAKDDGIELYVKSGYRSFEEQESLKSAYTVTYGAGANTFSADQGYSEHQLGTTVDFITTGLEGELAGFGETEAYRWLRNNAHHYGFILSYPQGNSYYMYEPWHWRFVGKDLADELHDSGRNFYDLEQREIDEYLVELFD